MAGSILGGAATGAAFGGPVGAVVGAAIPAIGGIVSSLINNNSVDAANAANRAWATQQQNTQNAYNLQMWNMTNAYNAPVAVMARLKSAGLNPNLAYGQIGGGLASLPPPAARAEYVAQPHPAVDFGKTAAESIAAFNDLRLGDAQINQTNANVMNALADAVLKGHQATEADSQTALNGSNQSLVAHQASALDAEVQLKKAQTWQISQMTPLDMAVQSGNAQKIQAEIDNLNANTQFTLNDDQRKTLLNSATISELIANAGYLAAQTTKVPAELAQIKQNVDLMQKDTTLKSMQIGITQSGGIAPGEGVGGVFRVGGNAVIGLGQALYNMFHPKN